MDLGHNSMIIEYEFDTKLIDTNTNYKTKSTNELFIDGIKQMDYGFWLTFSGALLLGYSIAYFKI